MRGGAWIVNPAGIDVSASVSSMRTTSEPACWVLLIDWIAFWASATAGAPTHNANARARARHLLII